jgi:hypothetical protein
MQKSHAAAATTIQLWFHVVDMIWPRVPLPIWQASQHGSISGDNIKIIVQPLNNDKIVSLHCELSRNNCCPCRKAMKNYMILQKTKGIPSYHCNILQVLQMIWPPHVLPVTAWWHNNVPFCRVQWIWKRRRCVVSNLHLRSYWNHHSILWTSKIIAPWNHT